MPQDFPDEHALCERCGYPLRGVAADARCPECGLSVDASHPRHRTGPAWQTRMSPAAWLAGVAAVAVGPARAFRAMRVDGSNLHARLFLLSIVLVVGVGWGVAAAWALARPGMLAWLEGMLAAKLSLLLTYVEAAGVAYFSRERGWRVGWTVAERIACYASPGWLLAAAVLFKLRLLGVDGWFAATPFLGGPLGRLVIWAALGGVAILGFETLVWLGVRQVRYANA